MKAVVRPGLWVLALTIFLTLPNSSSALPKFVAGKTYCGCSCAWGTGTNGGSGDLYWEKVGTCSLANGKKCSYTDGAGTHQGTLNSCMECQPDGNGGALCSASSPLASGAISPTSPAGMAPPVTQPGTTRLPAAPRAPLAPLAR